METTEYGHLLVDGFGVSLRKKRGRILVVKGGEKKEFPIKSIKEIVVMGKAAISSELLKVLAQSGVDMLITTPTGRPVARLMPAKAGGTARNRYEQYRSLEDRRGIEIARAVIIGKIRNQASNLSYYSKSRRMNEKISSELYEAAQKLKNEMEELQEEEFQDINDARRRIMARESRCADLYWEKVSLIMEDWKFKRREKRTDLEGRELDPVNLCLNVCYNLLSAQIWKNVLRFGLDPFLGYLHVERPGRISLVYDLMEPFRPIVDRFVFSYLKGMSSSLFSEGMRGGTIASLRNRFFSDFMSWRLEYKGRKLNMETIMFLYIRDVVSFLREGREPTMPYIPW
ncbi:MAG: CRISPR-associated endonuclease Cas1 [Candidatus Methanodesulfokora sp.]